MPSIPIPQHFRSKHADDSRDTTNVQSPRSYVSCYKYPCEACFEIVQGLFTVNLFPASKCKVIDEYLQRLQKCYQNKRTAGTRRFLKQNKTNKQTNYRLISENQIDRDLNIRVVSTQKLREFTANDWKEKEIPSIDRKTIFDWFKNVSHLCA